MSWNIGFLKDKFWANHMGQSEMLWGICWGIDNLSNMVRKHWELDGNTLVKT
jgi:hypothetical protein